MTGLFAWIASRYSFLSINLFHASIKDRYSLLGCNKKRQSSLEGALHSVYSGLSPTT
jgi:hypothetical protein